MLNYNEKNKDSIYTYARKLKGKTFKDICEEDEYFLTEIVKEVTENEYQRAYGNKKRKGGLGEIIEERYFHYKADNEARADFPEAEVELKVTPYKINKNNTISAKERLIVSMINYMEIVQKDFYNSNVWEKIKNILMVFYLWDPEIKDRLDYKINYVHMYSPIEKDLNIIINDYKKIQEKVIEGNAHELSEGDTLYLGAATKSSSSNDRREQPFSNLKAKPRAFSLKASYMTYILRNYILEKHENLDSIVDNESVENFEEYILNKLKVFKGISDEELFKKYFLTDTPKEKNKHSRVGLYMLGVNTENAEEFEKANIEVKAIRIEENGKNKESISLPFFKIEDFLKERWEESNIYNYFSEKRILFIIYKKKGGKYYLDNAKFWNMSLIDINTKLKDDWKKYYNKFESGVKFIITKNGKRIENDLPKKKDTEIIHIRPHASKSSYLINGKRYGNGNLARDSDLLPNGDRMTKQSFWINNDYILKQILNKD